jgi:hypothetical protein
VRTLHPILATLSTPLARPVIAAVRLRRGQAAYARGAGPFTAEALAAARQAGASGTVVARADSQFYNADVVAACRRAGARFSLTVRMNPHLAAAITQIPDEAWTPVRYPEAFVSGQGELFTPWRYHPVFTDSPFTMLQTELQHRQHAVIEQVIADGKSGPLAHLPSGRFQAINAWLALWAIAFNLLRAAGCLAGAFHARATTATLRAYLVNIPARIARSARRVTLHLPSRWPWQHAFTDLFDAAHAPPA